MAAKRKIHPPKPSLDRPWSELTKAERNKLYVRALNAYMTGKGPNPSSSTAFARAQVAAEEKP
jgi:hypothetical protein